MSHESHGWIVDNWIVKRTSTAIQQYRTCTHAHMHTRMTIEKVFYSCTCTWLHEHKRFSAAFFWEAWFNQIYACMYGNCRNARNQRVHGKYGSWTHSLFRRLLLRRRRASFLRLGALFGAGRREFVRSRTRSLHRHRVVFPRSSRRRLSQNVKLRDSLDLRPAGSNLAWGLKLREFIKLGCSKRFSAAILIVFSALFMRAFTFDFWVFFCDVVEKWNISIALILSSTC